MIVRENTKLHVALHEQHKFCVRMWFGFWLLKIAALIIDVPLKITIEEK